MESLTLTEEQKKIDQELGESPKIYAATKPEPIASKRKQYKLEKKIGDNEDGTIQVEYLGTYPTIPEVAKVLGFKAGKTFNIYQRKNKLAEQIIITKI